MKHIYSTGEGASFFLQISVMDSFLSNIICQYLSNILVLIWGNTQWCSGVPPGSALGHHS